MGGPPNPLPTEHPWPLETSPPIGSYKFVIKRGGERRSRDPPMDSGLRPGQPARDPSGGERWRAETKGKEG
jgi:hypothetical protein